MAIEWLIRLCFQMKRDKLIWEPVEKNAELILNGDVV